MSGTFLDCVECVRCKSNALWHLLLAALYDTNTAEWLEVQLGVETCGSEEHWICNFPHGFNAAFAELLWPLVVKLQAARFVHKAIFVSMPCAVIL